MEKKTPSGGGALKTFSGLERGLCYGVLGLLALIPAANVLLRLFGSALFAASATTQRLFLLLGFLAAMMTTGSGEHISITAVQYIKNEPLKKTLAFITSLISVVLLTVLVWDSAAFIKYGLAGGRLTGFIPERLFAAALPAGYAIMAFRFAWRSGGRRERIIAFSAIAAGCVCALPAIVKLVWNMNPPEPFYSWVDFLYVAARLIRFPVILLLICAALSGTPVFAAIGGIAMIMFQAAGSEPDAAPIQIFYAFTDTDNLNLVAIPLFTLTGFFLSESKAGERLVRTFRSLFSWIPGGMVIAAVIICAFFTSFTGASGVTILALGGILYTILTGNKYSERFSIGLLTSAGGIGLMFPPSLPIILVGSSSGMILKFMGAATDYGIVHFFLGAIIPGIILVLAMIGFGIASSVKVKIPVEPFDLKKAVLSMKDSAFEILLPFVLIAGYFSGLLSLLEASAVSVIYVLIVEVFIHRDIRPADIHKVFAKAVPIIGGVLAILAMARALSYAIIDSGAPKNFAVWMQSAIQSKIVFLLLLNLALLVVGCLMDIFSAILVVLPLIVPLAQVYGIDPVHLGIIFVMNLEVGFLTPPVGLNLFLASYRFEKPFMRICRFVLPFLLIQLAVVLLITYIPWLSTYLPSLFK